MLDLFDYYGDDTFGQIPGYHTVVLRGTAVANQGNSTASEIANTIRYQLNQLGYGVPAVRVEWSDGLGGYLNYGINLEIEVNARNEDPAEYVRQLITQAAGSITWTTVASTYSYLTNIALRVESDDYVAPSGGNTGGQSTGTGGGGNTNYGQPNAGVNPTPQTILPGAGSGTHFIDNFATGLGVSTPVIIAGGAVLLLLLLKK